MENVIERSLILARTRGSNIITLEDVLDYRGIREYKSEKLSQGTIIKEKSVNTDAYKLELIEKQEIERALRKNKANISKTARELGIARNTLYRKIKRYNIHV